MKTYINDNSPKKKKRQLKEASSSAVSDNFLGNKGRVCLRFETNQQRENVNR